MFNENLHFQFCNSNLFGLSKFHFSIKYFSISFFVSNFFIIFVFKSISINSMKKTKVKSIKRINYTGKVYDLCFDNEHYFYASREKKKRNLLIHNSLPDIDVDFESGTDHLTNEFLYSKYGKERVFPVITFYAFNEKGCIKDVTRALGQDAGFSSDVFATTKEMPDKWDCTLEEWIENYITDEFANQQVVDWLRSPKTQDIIKNTLKLQGNVRSLGKHAAGVIITPSPIWNYIPVNMVSGEMVSGFQESGSGKDLSDLGILKIDRLNLTTLNIIKQTIQNAKETQGIDITDDVKFLDIENPELFYELKNGFNSGVFQFESDGITHLAKSIDVETFDEVVATTSLYRPGPMGVNAHNDYIKNKFNPDKIEYVNDKLAPLLKNTKGVLIYQEQLMFIAKEIGGMTLGEGDNLRKVMDKASKIIGRASAGEELSEKEKNDKSYKEYLKLWEKFKGGAKGFGYQEDELMSIEAWLVKYLGYSFNLSHASAYSYLTMQTLFLKKYYPTEFYCALLNNQKGGSDKDKHKKWLYSAIQGATSKGILVKKPNIKSKWGYTISPEGEILMGFSSINGVGEKAYAELIDKGFSNMTKEDFFNTKWSKFNKSAFEGCLKAGVFDEWSESREELAYLREGTKAMTKKKKEEYEANKKDFAIITQKQKDKDFYEVCEIDFTVLGKLAYLQKEFKKIYGKEIKSVINFDNSNDWYYFYIEKIEQLKTKKGNPYYSLKVGDGGSFKKMNMWDNHYTRWKHILSPGKFYVTRFLKEDDFLNFDKNFEIREASL